MPPHSGLPPQVLLGALLGRGVLTARQAADVSRLIEGGASLEQALARVPLVSSIELADLGVLPSMLPSPDATASEAKPALPTLEGTSRDEDGVPLLELGDVDIPPVIDSSRGAGATMRRQQPAEIPLVDASQLAPERLDAPPPAALETDDKMVCYGLANDEGIPLVRLLNELLTEALTQQAASVLFSATGRQGAVAYYDRLGARLQTMELDAGAAGKILARLKVMGRLSPWKDEGTGVFAIERRKVIWRSTVTASRVGVVQRVVLSLAEMSS